MRIGDGNRVVNLAVAPRSADGEKNDDDIPEGTVENDGAEAAENAAQGGESSENTDAQAEN